MNGIGEIRTGWRSRLLRAARGVGIGFAVFIGALALWMLATPEGRVAWRTTLFIPQVVGTLPVNPQPWLMGEPSREEVFYETALGTGSADLYAPAGDDVTSGVLLFLGVNPAGRDDPRVVGLAEGLARSGAVVMIPWSEGMTSLRVKPEEIEDLIYAFRYLEAHPRVDAERAGVGGFCVGASLLTVAASDPRISDDVRFVNFFAGYYDARDLAAAVLSESRYYGGVVETWEPDRLSREVVTAQLIEGMSDPAEASALSGAFIAGDAPLDEAALSSMSDEARTVHRLLTGPDADEARGLIDTLPEPSLDTLRRISPSESIEGLKARVLIMHDRADGLVPSDESRRLADALSERGDFQHTEFSLFKHVDPTKPVGPLEFAREMGKLYRHMYLVLSELR